MKRTTRLARSMAVVGVASLILVACGGDDEPETEGGGGGTESPAEEGGDALHLGRIAAETGDLAALGPPVIAGVDMAIAEINAAGGVNGQDVELTSGDEGGQADIVRESAQSMVNAGVQGVIGAMASGMSLEVIQTFFDNEISQCSSSNTSPSFTAGEDVDAGTFDNGFYHRTVPPDAAVAPVIANQVLADGATNVAIAVRADDYGKALGQLVKENLESQGATASDLIQFNPETTQFDAEVSAITDFNPDAVVIISFGEGATLIRQLVEANVDAGTIYGGDGIFGPTLATDVNESDPGFISGLTVIGASGDDDFNTELDGNMDEANQGNYIYGAQAYDCTMILTLAAIAADSVEGSAINDAVADVTKGGEKCESFEDCKKLLEDGEDIDYDGASGPLEIEGTDPTFGRYAIAQFQDDGSLEVIDSQDVDLSEIE